MLSPTNHKLQIKDRFCLVFAEIWYASKLVKLRPKDDLLSYPRHPYSELLLAAVPRTSKESRGERVVVAGEPPDLVNLPNGCVFRLRCKYAADICAEEEPQLTAVANGHFASCHFADELKLAGIN